MVLDRLDLGGVAGVCGIIELSYELEGRIKYHAMNEPINLTHILFWPHGEGSAHQKPDPRRPRT